MNEIDKYIASFPPEVQERMNQLRALILEIAPEAEESMAYAMPAYKTNRKPLVYFAGYKNHIGFYATPTGHEQFKAELSAYKQGRGSVQFPLNKPLPLELIREMILFKFNEIRTDNQ
jgi:uncharacterized protein YdhG (YjbR/CyaY superfamily)